MADLTPGVLIYAHYVPPHPSASATRMRSLARYLTQSGHAVNLLTSQAGPTHVDGINIIRCKNRLGLLITILKHRKWSILVSSPPGTPAAEVALMARLFGMRVIVDIRDPYVSEALANGEIAPGLKTNIKRWLESCLLKVANGLSYVSEPLRLTMNKHFSTPMAPYVIAPNGIDLDIFHLNPATRRHTRLELGAGDEPVFVYAGILGGKSLDKAIQSLAQPLRDGAKLLIIGVLDEHSKPIKEELEVISSRLGIYSNIIWRFNEPLDQVARLLNACDIGINPLPDTRLYCLPVKTFEYLACGLLPLCITGSNSALSALFPSDSTGVVCYDWAEFARQADKLASNIAIVRSQSLFRADFAKRFDRNIANRALSALLLERSTP